MRQLLSAAKEYIKNKAIAEIYVEGETWRYQLLKESDEFLFVHNCYDWHFCEYIVFVKKYLTEASLKYGRLEAFRNRLFWSLKQCKCEADWIDLTSFNALFQSIRDNYNKISIYESTKKSNTFLMGKIAKYDD
ncbi:MAG: hypothetical protein LBO72_00360, partial [Helicobacteraceae bacterium]|nr:hypothetical protein [Helicobacteraceae bacterium]